MTRERFIKKWLGNNDFKYCEEHKELMREDLDRVIEFAQQQVKNCLIADVVGSLPLIEIDKEMLQMCVEMYKSGDKITAVKWLMEEAKKDTYTFGIKWASEYLEKQ